MTCLSQVLNERMIVFAKKVWNMTAMLAVMGMWASCFEALAEREILYEVFVKLKGYGEYEEDGRTS